MIKLGVLVVCALCLIGCAAERHGRDRFASRGGLVSDWPQFMEQSFLSNFLMGTQPVDPPSAYRDM